MSCRTAKQCIRQSLRKGWLHWARAARQDGVRRCAACCFSELPDMPMMPRPRSHACRESTDTSLATLSPRPGVGGPVGGAPLCAAPGSRCGSCWAGGPTGGTPPARGRCSCLCGCRTAGPGSGGGPAGAGGHQAGQAARWARVAAQQGGPVSQCGTEQEDAPQQPVRACLPTSLELKSLRLQAAAKAKGRGRARPPTAPRLKRQRTAPRRCWLPRWAVPPCCFMPAALTQPLPLRHSAKQLHGMRQQGPSRRRPPWPMQEGEGEAASTADSAPANGASASAGDLVSHEIDVIVESPPAPVANGAAAASSAEPSAAGRPYSELAIGEQKTAPLRGGTTMWGGGCAARCSCLGSFAGMAAHFTLTMLLQWRLLAWHSKCPLITACPRPHQHPHRRAQGNIPRGTPRGADPRWRSCPTQGRLQGGGGGARGGRCRRVWGAWF